MPPICQQQLIDSFQRPVNYLRISVTDRCNLNCRYCSPFTAEHLDRDNLLTLEEIFRIALVGTRIGINKIRLTGGEPLVRKGIVEFIERLCANDTLQDLALTTNGTLLTKMGNRLKQAGLKRVNISLDTLKREKFHQITRADMFHQVWDGIMTAAELAFNPVKINTVMMKGVNDDEIEDIAALSLKYPFHIRFIEYMPIGTDPTSAECYFFSIEDIKKRLNRMGNLIEIAPTKIDGPARRYRFEGAPGEIGLIGSMSAHFCSTCNRIRLTAAGQLRPCLLAEDHVDVIKALRNGADDQKIEDLFYQALSAKKRRHQLTFSNDRVIPTKMVSIGG